MAPSSFEGRIAPCGVWAAIHQHAVQRNRLVLWNIVFLVTLTWSVCVFAPLYKIPKSTSGLEHLPCTKEIEGHSMRNIIDRWPKLSIKEQRQRRQVFVHRGLSSILCGDVLPESSSEAGIRALEFGFAIIEIDVVVDGNGNLIIVHDRNGFRQTRGEALWREVDFHELPNRMKQFIWRKIENGQYTAEYIETPFFVKTLDDYIAETIASYPGATLLLDCYDDDPVVTIRHLSNTPHLFSRVMIQVYDFGFSTGRDFVERIEASGAAPGWEGIHLVISPHPVGIKKIPGLDPNDAFNANATLDAVKQWAQSFENLGLNIFGVDVPQTGFFRYYDPITRKMSHDHFSDDNLKDQERLAIFYDWVLHEFAIDYKQRHPHRMLLAPASTYTIGAAGEMLISAIDTGMLTAQDPADLRHRMFLEASLPQTVFECGADAAISDRPYDAVAYLAAGKRLKAPEGYQYPPKDMGKFGLPATLGQNGANGWEHLCYPEVAAQVW